MDPAAQVLGYGAKDAPQATLAWLWKLSCFLGNPEQILVNRGQLWRTLGNEGSGFMKGSEGDRPGLWNLGRARLSLKGSGGGMPT